MKRCGGAFCPRRVPLAQRRHRASAVRCQDDAGGDVASIPARIASRKNGISSGLSGTPADRPAAEEQGRARPGAGCPYGSLMSPAASVIRSDDHPSQRRRPVRRDLRRSRRPRDPAHPRRGQHDALVGRGAVRAARRRPALRDPLRPARRRPVRVLRAGRAAVRAARPRGRRGRPARRAGCRERARRRPVHGRHDRPAARARPRRPRRLAHPRRLDARASPARRAPGCRARPASSASRRSRTGATAPP